MLNVISKNQKSESKCKKLKRKQAALPGCSEDYDAVATLPDDWVPRHSGPILANYLKQREHDHDIIIQDIYKGAAAVNEDVDSKIRMLAESLLTRNKVNQHDMDCIIEQCNTAEGSLNKENCNDAFILINKLFSQRVDDVVGFKREALVIEQHRADGLRVLFRNQFQRLIAVGHKTPKDLLNDIEQQTYAINQQLLSNSRAYSELEAQLRVQADESVARARMLLNQLCFAVEKAPRGRGSLHWLAREEHAEIVSENQSVESPIDGIEQSIDAVVSNIVQVYRSAVYKVYNGFFSKLNELNKDLHSLTPNNYDKYVCEFADMRSIVERSIVQLSNNINHCTKNMMEITGADLASIQKSLTSLSHCLQDVYFTLHSAGHLWDNHILRSAHCKKLTIAAVEDMLTSNDLTELANEVPFNIAIEQMKSLSDPDKVKQQLYTVTAMLDYTAEMYMKHSQAEIAKLEEFMNTTPVMVNTLLAEFQVFLENHPRSALKSIDSDNNQRYLQTPRASTVSLHLPLSRLIMQTELQELALRNWRNGFLESFENNVSLVPEELRHQAQLWVDERGAALQMRHSLKMVSHSVRAERVKAAYEARLAELHFHEDRLNTHLEAVYTLVENLPLEASDFGAFDAPYMYPLYQWVYRIEADLNALLSQESVEPEVKRLKMSSYSCRLTKHRRLFEEFLDAAIEDFKQQMGNRIQEARISNVRFVSQIRMFIEGGRYSAQEATKAVASLMRGAEALESCIQRAIENLNRRRNQLLALVEHELLPLQRTVGDVIKPGKGQDKKTGKKK